MVYSNKFVMSVIFNGLPQKELANGVVKLPFGAEYSLRFRNKNNRRAVVRIYIDGEDVSGNGYVVPANDYIDIKRHHDVDRSFKFVSLDSGEAVEFGKNGPNNDKVKGTIEARFFLEKEHHYYTPPVRQEVHHHHHHYPRPRPQPWPIRPYEPIWYGSTPDYRVTCDNSLDNGTKTCSIGGSPAGSMLRSSGGPSGQSVKSFATNNSSAGFEKLLSTDCHESNTCSFSSAAPAVTNLSEPVLKDGCTVEGDSTGQRFTTTWIETEDNYTSLKVFLQGFEDEEVQEAQPKKARKTNKDKRLTDLEAENEELRRKLAEAENETLKKKLAAKEKKPTPKKRTRAKKKTQ